MFLNKLNKYFKDPSDVYSAIHPLFKICNLFGLAPYSVNRLENGKKVFKFDWKPLVRNAVLIILLMGSLIYHMILQPIPFSQASLKDQLHYFQETFCSLLSCCAVIFGCIFAVKIIEVFKNIEEVDVSFRTLAVWVPYKSIYIKIIIHLVLLFLLTIGLLVYFIWFAPDTYNSQWYTLYITFMTIILPYLIHLLMELQYGHYLNILRIRYKLLNEYLETLVQETQTCSVIGGWTEGEITKTKKNQPKKIFSADRKISKSMTAISDPVYIVDQVVAFHIKLTDTAHMINYGFCVQQLLRITVTFISIVSALFLIAINFSKSASQKEDSQIELDYFYTFWAFSNACEVMAIVWITSETCEEANTCPRILHKIRNNTNDTNLQDTIEIYSLQMYHNRLSFTVCGLFPLDYTLLYTIVAGVTTYLVILIQFNNADFVKKNSTTISEQ